VLASRRGARTVRTRVEVQEHTDVGDALIRGLMRAQLGLALRLAALTLLVLCSIPVVMKIFPELTEVTIFGILLPWWILGFAVYPLLLAVCWVYNRRADRNEQEFGDLVDD
jgi:putative solute:sodium symporter small subunit